jgi:hypothetical protein
MFLFDKYSSRKWTHIIIHHSYSPDDGSIHNWDEIAAYHKSLGWAGIGYNFGIQKVGTKYVYCIGRGLDCIGAHTIGMNETAVGIVLVGNYDAEHPTPWQYALVSELCKDLMRDFNISIDNIQRHSQYSPKTCPGEKFDMEILKSYITDDTKREDMICPTEI